MTIADKLTLLANTKEALRAKLKISKSIPFSKYPDYIDWASAPSIPNKAFYADFTNDRYVKDGVPCGFKDLFTFTRAGKAWLVKESGLQEYATDVPRLDNGLLIEQSATNYHPDSLITKAAQDFTGVSLIAGGGFKIPANNKATAVYSSRYTGADIPLTASTLLLGSTKPKVYPDTSSEFYMRMGVAFNYTYIEAAHGGWVVSAQKLTGNTNVLMGVVRPSNYDTSRDLNFKYFQVESPALIRGTTLIVTNTTPVTRPADFLLNKITGTTVTGDWDSTLNLSIVAGNLVHSGHGRIRSLEIN